MKQVRTSKWPPVKTTVSPDTLERLDALADERAVSRTVLIREALAELLAPSEGRLCVPGPFSLRRPEALRGS